MRRRAFLGAVGGGVAATGVASVTAAQPSEFAPLGSVGIRGAKEAVPGDDGVAYVATTDGFAVVDASDPAEPTVVAERRGLLAERDGGPLEAVWDVKVEGDRLVAVGPANPGDPDRLQGAAVFDVSDPASPERTAFHETDFSIHNCFLRDGRVYLTGNDEAANPLVVVDLGGDTPTEVARWSLLDVDDAWADVNPWLRWQHDVWVGGDTVYLAHWDAGTWLLDADDLSVRGRFGGRPSGELAAVPDDEVNAGVVELPGNSHYAMPNDDGSVVAVNAEAWGRQPDDGRDRGPGGVELWNVADAANAERIAHVEPPRLGGDDARLGDAVRRLCHGCGQEGPSIWRTAHNLDLVGDRLFTSWYQGGVRVFDVSDPASPRELASWRDPERASLWTAKRLTPATFVAPSTDHRDARGALYTFPVPDGESASATRV